MKKKSIIAAAIFSLLLLNAAAFGQCVSLTTIGSAYTQNFDTLSNTAGSTTNNLIITGWFMTETGGGARDNEQYAVDTGASNTGDTYSYGSAGSTERALGGLRTGTLIPIIGSCYTNNTGATVNSLAVAYTGEQWRLGTAGRTDQINFEYSANATDLVTGTWTNVAALNFVTPDTAITGAKDGNAASSRTARSSTISSLSIANGATFWIRWTDTDASGADDGLAVDDFSLTPNFVAPAPNLTINDVSLNEGNAGTTNYTFTVSLSSPAPAGGVTFDIATADGIATAPSDYTAKLLIAQSIPFGSSTYTFTVAVNGDTTVEPNESFSVNVTNVTGANVTDGQGQGTIVNDDAAGTIQFGAAGYAVGEGDGTASLTVTRTGGSSGAVTANYSLGGGTATGGATCAAGVDYVNAGGTVTFTDGDAAAKTISVTVCDDADFEGDETFSATLSNPTGGASLGGITLSQVTIFDNDSPPVLSISSVSQAEGNSGTTNFVFTVTKTGGTTRTATVNFATVDGTATTAGGDYQATSGTLTFLPDEPSKTITVAVNGDAVNEPNESFTVDLSSPSNANIDMARGFGTILDDESSALPVIEFAQSNYEEDESQTLVITVNRTGNTSGTSTVDYSVPQNVGSGATGGTACTTGVDYVTPQGTLTFAPGDESKNINIEICSDTLNEPSEFFLVSLTNPTNATLGNNSFAVAQITDAASQFRYMNPINLGAEANPYPAPLTVANAPSRISGLRVTLFDFFDGSPDDIDILLVGPQGQNILLMADAGGANALLNPATITFDDGAGVVLPDNSLIASGKYEPTTWESGQTSFPPSFGEQAPPPPAPYNEPGSTVGGPVTLASVFGGTNPNGEWRLYVRLDNTAPFQSLGLRGSIASGWGLEFLAPTAANVSVGGQLHVLQTPVVGATVMLTGGDLTEPRLTRTNSFGNYKFEGLTAGQTYIVSVVSSRYRFPQSSLILNVDDSVFDADFEAEER